MIFNRNSYVALATERAKRTDGLSHCLWAFFVGGGICALGEAFYWLFTRTLGAGEKAGALFTCSSLIFLSFLFTGLGLYDKLAAHAGAGTILPITGFANAVVSPCIDSRAEGYVTGVGIKAFTVAGPVLFFGTVAGILWGMIYQVILWVQNA